MTLLFMDGFDNYVEAAELLASGRWIAPTSSSVPDPDFARSQGRGVRVTGNLTTSSWTPETEVWVGFAAYFQSLANTTILIFLDSAGVEQCRLSRTVGGNLTLGRGGTVLGTSAGTFSATTWRYVEVRAFVSNTVGTMEVWVDGVLALSVGPVDTSNSGTPEVARVQWNSALDVDDVYVLSTAGVAPLNARLGDVRAAPIDPAGPGAATNWISNGLTNHRSVADTNDGDYTLNQTNVVGATDLFDYQDPQISSGSILAAQVVTTARRGTAGPHDIVSVVRSNGVNYENAVRSLATSSATFVDVVALNPDTGLAWAVAELRDAEFGYRLKT